MAYSWTGNKNHYDLRGYSWSHYRSIFKEKIGHYEHLAKLRPDLENSTYYPSVKWKTATKNLDTLKGILKWIQVNSPVIKHPKFMLIKKSEFSNILYSLNQEIGLYRRLVRRFIRESYYQKGVDFKIPRIKKEIEILQESKKIDQDLDNILPCKFEKYYYCKRKKMRYSWREENDPRWKVMNKLTSSYYETINLFIDTNKGKAVKNVKKALSRVKNYQIYQFSIWFDSSSDTLNWDKFMKDIIYFSSRCQRLELHNWTISQSQLKRILSINKNKKEIEFSCWEFDLGIIPYFGNALDGATLEILTLSYYGFIFADRFQSRPDKLINLFLGLSASSDFRNNLKFFTLINTGMSRKFLREHLRSLCFQSSLRTKY